MIDIEQLLSYGELERLRQGKSKETYRHKDMVIGVIRLNKLKPADRDGQLLQASIEEYEAELRSCGVKTVELMEVGLQRDSVVIVTRYMPQFFDGVLARGQIPFPKGMELVLKDVVATNNSEVGIDPAPGNYGWNEGEIYYADYYLPYTRDYIRWLDSHVDVSSPRDRYLQFSRRHCFFPLVLSHVIKDFADLKLDHVDACINYTDCFCRRNGVDFNARTEYADFVCERRSLRSALSA